MTTLAELKLHRMRLTIHCEGMACAHYTDLSIDQLIQYLGTDFDLHQRRGEFLSRFVCERCGGRDATIRIMPASGEDGLMAGAGGVHDHGPMPTAQERERRAAAFETEFRSRGGRTNAEIAAYWRQWRKDRDLAEQGKGAAFIGPPNPWTHRKRGRWL